MKIFVLFLLLCVPTFALNAHVPSTVLNNIPFNIVVDVNEIKPIMVLCDGQIVANVTANQTGEYAFPLKLSQLGTHKIVVRQAETTLILRTHVIPGILSIIPPIASIGCSIIVKNPQISLFLGVFVGVSILSNYNFAFGLVDSLNYCIPAISDNFAIVLFGLMLGGILSLLRESGGVLGLKKLLRPITKNKRQALLVSILVSIIMSFDDYACVLLTGGVMKDILKAANISPVKQAFMFNVPAMSLPAIFPMSSWVGMQISSFKSLFTEDTDVYSLLLSSIPYNFYPIFMAVFMSSLAFFQHDFSAMHTSEWMHFLEKNPQVRSEHQCPSSVASSCLARFVHSDDVVVEIDHDKRPVTVDDADRPSENVKVIHSLRALVPILLTNFSILTSLLIQGYLQLKQQRTDAAETNQTVVDVTFSNILRNGNYFDALIWGTTVGTFAALVCTCFDKKYWEHPLKILDLYWKGMSDMLGLFVILLFAWGLGAVCGELHTGDFIISSTGGLLKGAVLPVITTVISAVVAFGTGGAFGTMAIMFPLVVPVAQISNKNYILRSSVAAVLSGAAIGSNISPINDTLQMAALITETNGTNVIHNQLPYVMVVSIISVVCGVLPVGMGVLNVWVGLALGSTVCVLTVFLFGRSSVVSA